MPLKKLTLKPGVNKENTRYTSENGWYECDKVRFRQGTPEKIGGWQRMSDYQYSGVCRSLFSWSSLSGAKYVSVGTNEKYYILFSNTFHDITPLRSTTTLTNPFATTNGSTTVTVTAAAHGANAGDYVTFSGASAVGGLSLNNEYRVTTVINANSYTITSTIAATATATGGGTVTAQYQIHVSAEIQQPSFGWGSGAWSAGPWGVGVPSTQEIQLWSQFNFGQDLILARRYDQIYYWSAPGGLTSRAVPLASLPGASDVPVVQSFTTVSDVSRFVMAFGCNDYGSTTLDPMLIRWSDQEDATNWTPAATNQAGSLRLSHGSEIATAMQARQEILVWTDVALYSLQYLGAPDGWGATILGDNISCISPNCTAYASGVAYWMGTDKFYKYDGKVSTLQCDLREYVFSDINFDQPYQIFSGTNENFSEVWWFYCTSNSTIPNRYVVYNYLENIWYYGQLSRTAWLDSGLLQYPIAATPNNKVVYHEIGVDDMESIDPKPISAFIESAEFDIDDGDRFGFVWRILPDVTFRGSTTTSPSGTLTLIPMKNSGSGYNTPMSVGGSPSATITRTATVPIEQFTGQVYVRVRGRQMILRMASDSLGTTWQLGSPRIDIKQDGRR